MHTSEVREEVGIVPTEIRKEFFVFVESKELTDDLDGDDLRVKERRGGSALSQAPGVLDAVVYEAEDGYDEGALRSTRAETSFLLG